MNKARMHVVIPTGGFWKTLEEHEYVSLTDTLAFVFYPD